MVSIPHQVPHPAKTSSTHPARVFFFVSVLRNVFVMIVLTIAAWLYCRHRAVKGKYPIKILGAVPRGFKHVGTPDIDPALVSALASQLPVATIILVLEHIAIAKCAFPSPSQLWSPLMRLISESSSVWANQRL
jgi:MFS superfamily sulfate permease-like transporter